MELPIRAALEKFQKEHVKLVAQLDKKLASGVTPADRLKENKRYFVTLSNVTIQVSHLFVHLMHDLVVCESVVV